MHFSYTNRPLRETKTLANVFRVKNSLLLKIRFVYERSAPNLFHIYIYTLTNNLQRIVLEDMIRRE